jgi:hypothetical protein
MPPARRGGVQRQSVAHQSGHALATNFTTAARVTDAITGAVLRRVTAAGTDIAGDASGITGTMTVGAVANSVSARPVSFARTL